MKTSRIFIQFLWKGLHKLLVGSNELKVWQTTDRGYTYWHAYEPVTGASVVCNSEAEMAAWIEEEYYKNQIQPPAYLLDRYELLPSQ